MVVGHLVIEVSGGVVSRTLTCIYDPILVAMFVVQELGNLLKQE